MDLKIKILKRDPYLHAAISGEFNLADFKKVYQQVIDSSVRLNQPRVIFDTRSMSGEISTMERYEAAVWIAQNQKARVRMVFFVSLDQIYPDKFAETVAINRGVQLKVTTDMEEAMQWLGIVPSVNAV